MRLLISSLLVVFASIFNFAWAADGGVVEEFQMPAWIEHSNGTKEPLKPGMKVNSGDVISTGSTARLLVRLEEGSLVKLGENGRLDFKSLNPPEEEQGFFEAALNVVRGAFRFTTTKFGQNRRRNVNVKIGVITAGIRGTDIWGNSTIEKDVLCLIEGKISAQRDGEPEFTMEDPLSFYIVPKDKPAEPVQPVPAEELAKWAAKTEVLAGGGVLSINGRWAVNLMSLNSENATQPLRTQLSNAGYATEVQEISINGRNWYRIRVVGFKTREDARTFADTIDGVYGIQKPWVVKF